MELSAVGVHMKHEGYFLRVPERGVHALSSRITEEENLFLLAHMGIAEIDPQQWRLRVGGLVSSPASFGVVDLLTMRQHEVISVHECAGSPLTLNVPKRRVGNVVWSGVRLADVLEQCGVAPGAAFVWTHGLERGDFADLKNEPYVKDLPLAKAMSPEVLLATGMNGTLLSPDRGGPVRLVVPGWYGTNSVKWIGALTVSDRRAPGPYTARFYNDPSPGGLRPVWGIAPESILVSPSPDDPPWAGEPVLIEGWAWAESGVAKVEISTEASGTWIPATLEARSDFGWQRFSLQWTFRLGQHQLSCRCFDAGGNGQPESGTRNAVHTIVFDSAARE
jgi:DMSO/TMAO reductase YedYZ molybdopterin-dependent catalytic subunit